MPPNAFAVIAGVGPGTGAAIVRKFARTYPVVLLARKAESLDPLVQELKNDGHTAFGIGADVSVRGSIDAAFQQIKTNLGDDATCAAAVFNASGAFMKKPFLEMTEDDLTRPFSVCGIGAFNFSQAALPLLLQAAKNGATPHPPSLIFTGATASLKASAGFSTFAPAKFAQRALAQSLAREFGSQGVHVAHVIIDGLIDVAQTAGLMKDAGPNAKLSPAAIAESYWQLHTQPLSAFTHELELRPFKETW